MPVLLHVAAWLLTYLLHSTLLLGGTWLLVRLRPLSHAAQDLLWKTALVGGLVTASAQSLGVGGVVRPAVAVLPAAPAPAPLAAAMPSGAHARPLTGVRAPQTAAPPPSHASAPAIVALDLAAAAAGAPGSAPGRAWWLAAFGAAWLVAAAFGVLRLAVVRWRLHRRLAPRSRILHGSLRELLDVLHPATGLPPVTLTCADALSSPVALGRAEICVPPAALTDLSRPEQRSMLAHELAHLVRRDPQWLAFAYLLEHVLFLQPMNALARRRLQVHAEFLCDDWAVARTGSGIMLARCLAVVAEWIHRAPRAVPLAGMAEQRSHLVARIERLVKERPMSAPHSRSWNYAALGTLAMVAVAVPGAKIARAANPSPAGAVSPAVPPSDAARRPEDDRASAPIVRAERGAGADVVAAVSPADAEAADTDLVSERRLQAQAWSGMRISGLQREASALAMARMRMPAALARLEAARARLSAGVAAPFVVVADGERKPADPRAVAALAAALKDSDAEVRAAAARALGNLGDSSAVPALIEAAKDPNKDVRQAALESLGSLQDTRSLDTFLAAAKDADPEIRQMAVSGLASFEDPRAVPVYVAALADRNTGVRQAAASGLGNLQLKSAPQALIDAMGDANADVREAAVRSVGSIQDPKAVPGLKARLSDSEPGIREAAVEALGEIRDASAMEAIIAALKDSRPEVRRAAASALGQRD